VLVGENGAVTSTLVEAIASTPLAAASGRSERANVAGRARTDPNRYVRHLLAPE
jgi:predicted ATPase